MHMSTPEKIASLKSVVAVMGEADMATATWAEENDALVLRVQAGDYKQSISARLGDDRDAAETKCVDYLLRKISFAAHRCPKCLAVVPRATEVKVKRYRCPECLHGWQDS